MNLAAKRALSFLVCVFVASIYPTTMPSDVLAEQCGGFVRSSIAGEGSRVKLGLEGRASGCNSNRIQEIAHEPQPYLLTKYHAHLIGGLDQKGFVRRRPVLAADCSSPFELSIVLMEVARRLGLSV